MALSYLLLNTAKKSDLFHKQAPKNLTLIILNPWWFSWLLIRFCEKSNIHGPALCPQKHHETCNLCSKTIVFEKSNFLVFWSYLENSGYFYSKFPCFLVTKRNSKFHMVAPQLSHVLSIASAVWNVQWVLSRTS